MRDDLAPVCLQCSVYYTFGKPHGNLYVKHLAVSGQELQARAGVVHDIGLGVAVICQQLHGCIHCLRVSHSFKSCGDQAGSIVSIQGSPVDS